MLQMLVLKVRDAVFVSKSVLFTEGENCIAAYLVPKRCADILSSKAMSISMMEAGKWICEKALVNPMLHRGGTCTTRHLNSMLVVPAKAFHDTVTHLGLKTLFQKICEYELPGGLC